MSTKTDLLFVAAFFGGLYLFRDKIDAAFSIKNPNNIANTTIETAYQAVTGSAGTPGGDLAVMVNTNADSSSLAVLESFFKKQGYNQTTIARAKDMGWTDTDIARATFWLPVEQ